MHCIALHVASVHSEKKLHFCPHNTPQCRIAHPVVIGPSSARLRPMILLQHDETRSHRDHGSVAEIGGAPNDQGPSAQSASNSQEVAPVCTSTSNYYGNLVYTTPHSSRVPGIRARPPLLHLFLSFHLLVLLCVCRKLAPPLTNLWPRQSPSTKLRP